MIVEDLQHLRSLEGQLEGKRVLLRTDFSVPIKNGEIENDFRIRQTLPTLAWLKKEGAKTIIISHIWGDETTSLKVVYDYLSHLIDITFCDDVLGNATEEHLAHMQSGDVVLLENLRLHEEELHNDSAFAQTLASYGDYYVNEAFSASHREHASIVGIPEYLPSYAGFQTVEEVAFLSRVFEPEHPFVFILGGAKFDTKVPLISKFLTEADRVHVTGALAHVYLEARGCEIGTSLIGGEDIPLGTAPEDERLITPVDMVVVQDGETREIQKEEMTSEDNIQDIGRETLESIKTSIQEASLIVWNGPLGNYENGFYSSTQECAQAIADSQALSIVGGGDTLAAISDLDIEDQFDFVSTGGGAMLRFLLNETLVGLEKLKKTL